MKALKYTSTEIDIDITDISLLTIEEAEALSENIRRYAHWWWLCSPGAYSDDAAYVSRNGYVYDCGDYVGDDDGGVRPALTIADLDSLNLKIGDPLVIQDKEYIYIGNNKVLYNDKPIYHRFNLGPNDYKKSAIKKIVDNWLKPERVKSKENFSKADQIEL